MEVGSVQARAASPSVEPFAHVAPDQPLPETAAPLPLQYIHDLPTIGTVASPATAADAPDTNLVARQQQFVVQAASFRVRDEAANLAEDLTQRGYRAGILDFKDPEGRSWLTVRVGPYAARAEASQAASELGRFTRTEPIVRVLDN
jgi:cell division septation protein DedD